MAAYKRLGIEDSKIPFLRLLGKISPGGSLISHRAIHVIPLSERDAFSDLLNIQRVASIYVAVLAVGQLASGPLTECSGVGGRQGYEMPVQS